MRPPANGSIQVSPTWSGHTPPAPSRSRPAIGENTAPGIASVVGAKRGGRGTSAAPRAARCIRRDSSGSGTHNPTPAAARCGSACCRCAARGAGPPRRARRRRAERAREPAQHHGLVLGLAVDAEVAVGGLRELDQVVERAHAVVAVDAVGVARPAARDRGAALAHLVDEARAARSVDAAEAQRRRRAARSRAAAPRPRAGAAREMGGLGRRGLVDPLAARLAVDGRARDEDHAARLLALRRERREQVAQPLDVGGAVERVVAAARRRRVHDHVERGRQIRERARHREVRRDRRDAGREVHGIAPQAEHVVAALDAKRARARFRRSRSRRSGCST